MERSVIKFIFFIWVIFTYSQTVSVNDINLINLVLVDVNNINKEKEINILNKSTSNKIKDFLISKRIIKINKYLIKKIDYFFFEKIKKNCISRNNECAVRIFSKEEIKLYYNKLFNDCEINNYESQLKDFNKMSFIINKTDINLNNVILSDRNCGYFTKPLYSKNNKYAFLIFKRKSKNDLYIFKRINKKWVIKWKKENLILDIRL